MKNNNTNKTKKRRLNKKNLLDIILIVIISIISIVGVLVVITLFNFLSGTPELDLAKFQSTESTSIYDANGELIVDIGTELRDNVEYSELPQSVIDAFVSVEDSRYFAHNGFDLPRFTKAFAGNLFSMSYKYGGGSTFTMQLVKNTYFTSDEESGGFTVSIERKVQEINLAMQLNAVMSKQDVLVNYLNMINFGGPARGIGMAANYYFNKSVSDISLSEAALLAGVINSPNAYNPYYNLELATSRRNAVLDLMLRHGYISEVEAELAKSIKVEDLLQKQTSATGNEYQFQAYIDTVIEEMQDVYGIDPYETPVNIYTSMNRDAQIEIEKIQNNQVDSINMSAHDYLQSAIIILDNDANIVAIGGGKDYNGERLFNRATSMTKQSGSTIKTVLSYALAFEYLGTTTASYVNDFPMYYPNSSTRVIDYDGNYDGIVSIQYALGDSRNVPAVDLLQQVVDKIGVESVVSYMNSIGFDSVTTDNYSGQEALGAGKLTTNPLQMAAAYNMLMNLGEYTEPRTVTSFQYIENSSTVTASTTSNRTLSEEAAYLAASLAKGNVDGCYFKEYCMVKESYPVYSKSGTTDWGTEASAQLGLPVSNGAKDKWLLTSTTDYTISVWIGFDKGIEGKNTYYNSKLLSLQLPGRITDALMEIMEETYSNPTELEKPSGVASATIMKGYTENYLPVDGVSSDYLVTGLYKQSGANFTQYPTVSVQEITEAGFSANTETIGQTVTVTATLPANTQSEYLTTASKKQTVTFGSKKYTGSRGADITWWAGTINYYMNVVDANGNILASTSSSGNTMSIDIPFSSFSSTNAEVCGYYAFNKLSAIKSNSVCIPITIDEQVIEPENPDTDETTDPNDNTDNSGNNTPTENN